MGTFQTTVIGWIENPMKLMLVITTVNQYGVLVAREALTKEFSSKSCFFIRKSIPLPFKTTDFHHLIIYGDTTSTTAVEELAVLVEEVYYPMLHNKANQLPWPEELRKNIQDKVQFLRDVVDEAKGNLLQVTILPKPVALNHLMELRTQILHENRLDLVSVKLRNSIESIVSRWCNLIDEVVQRNDLTKARPDVSVRQLTPDMEIQFWQKRYANLENIYEQMQDEKFRTTGQVLERIRSGFRSGSFRATFRGLIAALEEARDITLWLKPLVIAFLAVRM